MDKNYKLGIFYGLSSYILWGVIPIYWKQLNNVDAMQILASRFLWSVVFVFILLAVTKNLKTFWRESCEIFSDFKTGAAMLCAAVLITFNWGIFIWAVDAGRIVETSMGYYINPLVSVLCGVVFLRERLTRMQIFAVLWAAVGIAYLILQMGSLPWISVGLALTFALYGLIKKIIKAQALTSIMVETLIISPLAFYYLYDLAGKSGNAYQTADTRTLFLLAGAGVVTAVPLLLFTGAARRVPLYMIGFMQYIAPSISLLVGVFMYGEAFTSTHAISFGCIWIGLVFFTWSQLRKN